MMKKHISFYLFYLLVSYTSLIHANDLIPSQESKALAVEKLREIVMQAFPPISYIKSEDRDPGDRHLLSQAALAKVNLATGALYSLPQDLFAYHIFPYLDRNTILRSVALTCKYFNLLTKMSHFYLNSYCLQEGMPHSIPLHILRSKMHFTLGGMVKLASLWSVSPRDLSEWFDKDMIYYPFRSPCSSKLTPSRVSEGTSDAYLGHPYPGFKIMVAYGLKVGLETPEIAGVMTAVRGTYQHGQCSYNELSMLTLNPDRPGNYYEILEELLEKYLKFWHPSALASAFATLSLITEASTALPVIQETPPAPASEAAVQTFIRELLLEGRMVARINQHFFMNNPNYQGLAEKLEDWCKQYPQFVSNTNHHS
jgi:hypothetical protein